MKKLDMKFKLLAAALKSNSVLNNLEFKVGGNLLKIGSIELVNKSSDSSVDFGLGLSKDPQAEGHLTMKGEFDYKVVVNDLLISGEDGERLSIEHISFESIYEAFDMVTTIGLTRYKMLGLSAAE